MTSFRTIDLNLLKIFEAPITEGSVTPAANAMVVTQPAVSKALSRLRKALGDPLFVRSGSGIRPTKRAIALWAPIGEALQNVREALDEQAFDSRGASTEFGLSMSDYVSAMIMPRLLRHLRRCRMPRPRRRRLPARQARRNQRSCHFWPPVSAIKGTGVPLEDSRSTSWAWMSRATSVDPVKITPAVSGAATSAAPRHRAPSPMPSSKELDRQRDCQERKELWSRRGVTHFASRPAPACGPSKSGDKVCLQMSAAIWP